MQLAGQTFIVTGGASGLGGSTVERLAQNGARVVIVDLNEKLGQELATKIGDNARFLRCDVTSETDAQAAVKLALDAFGGLHGLVNCAGIGPPGKVLGKEGALPLAKFNQIIQINLVGSFNMIRLAAEAMSKQEPDAGGERGVLINTASVAAYDGQIGQPAYAASKAGVVGMTLPIARELARFGIRCVTIAPGLFETPLLLSLPPEAQESLGRSVPFPSRLGRPAEFAQLVQSIIENPMINGETIRLDGALRMAPK